MWDAAGRRVATSGGVARRFRQWVILAVLSAQAWAATTGAPAANLLAQERTLWSQSFRRVPPGPVGRPAARCEHTQAAEALATPDPLLDAPEAKGKIAVSFIIGIDGRVHSPVVLESAGTGEDSAVLEAVRGWRYRPATCNAVPAEAEGTVEFSRR